MPSLSNWIVHIKDVNEGHHIIEPTVAQKIDISIEQSPINIFTFNGMSSSIPGRSTGQINMEFVFNHNEVDNFSLLWEQGLARANIQINRIDSDDNNHIYENCLLSSVNWGTSNEMSTIEIGWVFTPHGSRITSMDIPSLRMPKSRRFDEQKLDWHELGF